MGTLPNGVRERMREVLDAIQQDGNPYGDELKAMYWFHAYAWETIEASGGVETGYNFRQKEGTCLLVYKAKFGDKGMVTFTTARTATQCMQSFARRAIAKSLEWKVDKYA